MGRSDRNPAPPISLAPAAGGESADGSASRDDLAGYRSGFSVITELVEEDVEVLFAGTTGVTFVTATVAGLFGGEPLSGRLRYTRTWTHDSEAGWRILAAHIAVLAPSGS